ncbi:universal stress protein [Streptomyces laurentii]|uniref:universal stress protein n=1 Tax=Streptomyces laurentii TaxID=39478 RepID=UPI0036C9FC55
MTPTTERREIVVGVDPDQDGHPALDWAADEALRRRLALRLVVAVPPAHDTQHVDDSPRHTARIAAARDALRTAEDGVRARAPEAEVSAAVVDGVPARVLAALSAEAALVVLGSRRLSRVEEFLSLGSLVVPVTAQARCPVVVVGDDAERTVEDPPYLVVGVDGSPSSRAAVALAFEEADVRGCALRAVAVREPSLFARHPGDAALDAERGLLAESTAGGVREHPDVPVTHEVLTGSPVERLADAAQHALAVIVGRRGQGGYSGMHVGSVVHGLLHRAPCPVITVPAR